MKFQSAGLESVHNELSFGPFGFYACNCLQIRTKDEGLKPFDLNVAQDFLDEILEDQLRTTGRVRVIILKGRQQGISTYVQGRFIRKVTTTEGLRAFILTHEQGATETLFGMAQRFVDHLPEMMRPHLGQSNAKALNFDLLDSGYGVGTAGNKAVGRSQTIQLFHGSEVAFWPNAEEHAKGILQAVPKAPGTEIILESTAQGIGNYFYQIWKQAELGLSDFAAIFIPWFWQKEYCTTPPDDFSLTSDEAELVAQYDLSEGQIYWRRQKIIELSSGSDQASGEIAFKQEYPLNAAEAFQYSGGDTLISARDCMRARKRAVPGNGDLVVGVDPSYGKDRFAVVRRQGSRMYGPETYVGSDVATFSQRVSICIDILTTEDPIAGKRPDHLILDWAVGADIADELVRLGYTNVRTVKFSEKAQQPHRYRNRRQEIYGRLVQWLMDPDFPVQIPDDDEFQADLCATPYQYNPVSEAKELARKEFIRQEFGFSPDLADAAALTFAFRLNNQPQPVSRKPRPVPILSKR